MKYILSFLTLSTIISLSHAYSEKVAHEKRDFWPNGWSRENIIDKTSPVRFRMALKQSNIHHLQNYLMDIAHPDSPNYGQLWTPDRVKETFAPSDDTIATVKKWLAEHGYLEDSLKLSGDRAWLEVNMTTEAAEILLETKYHHFRQGDDELGQIACDSYSLPSHVAEHIDFIIPGVALRSGHKKRSLSKPNKYNIHSTLISSETEAPLTDISPDSLGNCSNAMTPACVRALYNFHYKFESSNPNAIAISEFTPQSLLSDDLDMFFQKFTPSLVGQRPINYSIDGGFQQTDDQSFDFNGESSLDFEYVMTFVAPQKVDLFQVGDAVQGGSFNNLADALDKSYCTFEGGDTPGIDGIYPDPQGFNEPESCGTVQTRVLSTSYGGDEFFEPANYLIRQCNEFGKIGLTGTTIIFSSGDSGVGGIEGGCIDKTTGQLSPNGTGFSPQAPASCPFVTAIGATFLIPGSSVNDPESGASLSGGGFSNVYPRPSYQDEAVLGYLRDFAPKDTKGHFNESNRGFPDISINGLHYTVAVNGAFRLGSGTSASAPVFASMIAAINDARMKNGKKPVGFINPSLYSSQFQNAFNDITNGSNPNCGTGGFVASKGWDPVTGVGTPNFPKLLELWLQLP